MSAQNCSNCSAPLTFESDEDIVRCGYCGTSNNVGGLRNKILVRLNRQASGVGAGCFRSAMIVLLLGVAGAVLGSLMAERSEPPSLPSVAPGAIPGIQARGAVGPSELGTIAGRGWVTVHAPPFEGTFGDFDPVANLEWALTMGRAWSTDAQLGAIYLDGATAEGVLDLSARDDWDVDYRLFSPGLRASARQAMEVSEETIYTELRFKIGEGKVTALLDEFQHMPGEDPPRYEPGCSWDEVMDKAVQGGLEPRPSYRVVMHHVGSGWRWAVSGKEAGSVTIPASSCADR